MANGKVTYGTTTYEFAKNYTYGYTKKNVVVRTVNESVNGVITVVNRYTRVEFVLPFKSISDAQLTALEAIEAYGLVTFYPYGSGVGMPSYTGYFTLSEPTYDYADKHDVEATFVESK